MAEGEELGVVGQPVGDLDAGDLGAAVQVVEMAPLLAGGEAQGEAGRQVAGAVQWRAVSGFQQDLEQLPVVAAGGAVAERRVGAAGGWWEAYRGVCRCYPDVWRSQRRELSGTSIS